MATQKHITSSTIKLSVIFSLLSVLIIFFVFNFKFVSDAFALATEHKPEQFTELSFVTTPASPLPSSAPQNVYKSFAFKIVNDESQATTYSYQVIMQTAVSTSVIGSGTVILDSNESKTINQSFVITSLKTAATIEVVLPTQNQTIRFRTTS